jgi:glycerol 3-phosphatase-1
MDGTIIDSTEAVIKNWQRIGREIGVDPEVILATSHGRRSIDVLQIYEPKLANVCSFYAFYGLDLIWH